MTPHSTYSATKVYHTSSTAQPASETFLSPFLSALLVLVLLLYLDFLRRLSHVWNTLDAAVRTNSF